MIELYKQVKCCLDNDHFIVDPKKFSCGHNACSECIESSSSMDLICRHCEAVDKKEDMKKAEVNKEAKTVFLSKMSNFFVDLDVQMDDMMKILQESKKLEVDDWADNLKHDVDICIDSLVTKAYDYGERLRNEIDKFKTEFKETEVFQQIQHKTGNLNNLKRKRETNYNSFIEKQSEIKKSKDALYNLSYQTKRIKLISDFDSNNNIISLPFLQKPFWTKIKNIDTKTFEVDKNLSNVAYMSQSNSIIVNCRGEGTLHIMDLNDSITTRIKYTHSRAHSMICIGRNDDIFANEMYPFKKINILSPQSTGIYIHRELICDQNLTITKMKVDFTDEQYPLYLSHTDQDKISVWNSRSCRLLKMIDINSPVFLEFTREHIYTTSMKNCIFIINKEISEIFKKISFDWLNPFGLFIDKNSNLITLSRDKSNSNTRFICIFSEMGLLSHKIEIDGIIQTTDVSFFDNKMFITNARTVQITDFE